MFLQSRLDLLPVTEDKSQHFLFASPNRHGCKYLAVGYFDRIITCPLAVTDNDPS